MAIAIELSADTSKLEAAFARAKDTVATQTAGMVSSVGSVAQAMEQALGGAESALAGLGSAGIPGLDQLENVLAGFGVQVQATSAATQFWIGALALGLKGFSVQEFVTSVFSANHELAQLALTATRLGLTNDQIQTLGYAMKTLGGLDTQTGLKSALDLYQKINTEFHDTAAGSSAGTISKLFTANGLSITDASGELKSFNDLLHEAALLISNAGSEIDKIQIAKLLGLSQDWIAVLEKGPNQLDKARSAAAAAGAVIDDSLIKKAVEFDQWWSRAWSSFTTSGKAAAVDVGNYIKGLFDSLEDPANLTDKLNNLQKRRSEILAQRGPSEDQSTILDGAIALAQGARDAAIQNAKDKLAADMADKHGLPAGDAQGVPGTYHPESNPFGALTIPSQKADAQQAPALTVKPSLPTNQPTQIPSTKSDATESADEVERYTNQLEKSVEVLKAQVAVFGLGNAERVKATDLAKAEAAARERGSALTDQERAKIEQLAQAHADETKRLEDLKKAQQAVAEATNYFGSQVIDVFDQMVFQGAKASDVMKNLAESIVKAALQATLLGSGPLAGLFGTQGQNGNVGGIFGSLGQSLASSFGFGGARAAGGAVDGGKSYLVGENGPEMIRMGASGTVLPNSVLTAGSGGSGSSPTVNVHNYGAEVQTSNSNGPSGPQIDVIVRQVIMKDLDQRGDLSRMLERRGLRRA